MPASQFEVREKYRYLNGLENYHEWGHLWRLLVYAAGLEVAKLTWTEAVPNALPVGQNSPRRPAHGLYAEKLSGTSFTVARHESKQTWLYRILPSCAHPPFERPSAYPEAISGGRLQYMPNQLRWDPFDHDETGTVTFVAGLKQIAGAGDATLKQGVGMLSYACGRSMDETEAFYSADGDLLIVAQDGVLDIRTELGWLLVRPMEICVIPRGVRYQVHLPAGPARGYALELYQGHFALPELGPIGSNGLANARDFQVPVACFTEDCGATAAAQGGSTTQYSVVAKFNHSLYATKQRHTPFDVVAWHGSYYPYKYDLGRFNAIGTISYDHPDPSIFTVLTAPNPATPGTAVADFVVFPPRWLVAEDTFRPPYYHRNTMSEFMGLISGVYDAKKGGEGGFVPGGASLHNVMSGHGPDAETAEKESGRAGAAGDDLRQEPERVGGGGCAFMFECSLMLGVTEWGLRTCRKVQAGYSNQSWGGVKVHWTRPEGVDAHRHLSK